MECKDEMLLEKKNCAYNDNLNLHFLFTTSTGGGI